MGRRTIRRTGASILAAAGVATALVVGAGGVANAATSTTMTCGSANRCRGRCIHLDDQAGSGESLPPNGDALVPSLLLSGGNELPAPPPGLFPSIGPPNWYGTQVLVDWHNNTTGESGRR